MFQRGKDGDLIFYTLNIHKNMPDDNRPIDERRWGEIFIKILIISIWKRLR